MLRRTIASLLIRRVTVQIVKCTLCNCLRLSLFDQFELRSRVLEPIQVGVLEADIGCLPNRVDIEDHPDGRNFGF